MSKLTVVFLKDTGHVLAGLTRADPPAATEPASALIGAGFTLGPVDGASTAITIPAAMLAAVTVDDQPGVVLDPLGFQVIEDPQQLKPPTVTAAGVAGSTVDTTISHLAAAGATVTVSNMPLAALTAVLVLQQVTVPSPPPRIVVTTLTVGTAQMVSGGFTAGDTWDVYAFVQTLGLVFTPAVKVA